MFYDERIESVKGQIAKKSIMICFFISLAFLIVSFAGIMTDTYSGIIGHVIFEAAIFLCTLIAMIVGKKRAGKKLEDERAVMEDNAFYNKAALTIIKIVSVVFSVVFTVFSAIVSVGSEYNFFDQTFEDELLVFVFPIAFFVIYNFRKNDIYVNYAFIDSDDYYKQVWKNIRKILFNILILFVISLLSIGVLVIDGEELSDIFLLALRIACFYFGTAITISPLYLLVSFLERKSYESEYTISMSSLIALFIAVGGTTLITLFEYVSYTLYLIQKNHYLYLTLGFISLPLGILCSLPFYIFLSYFAFEYLKLRKNKLISISCVLFLISIFVLQPINKITLGVFWLLNTNSTMESIETYNNIASFVLMIVSLAQIAGRLLIVFALIKDKLISKAHRVPFIVLACVDFLFRYLPMQPSNSSAYFFQSLLEMILYNSVLWYLAILVFLVKIRIRREETLVG